MENSTDMRLVNSEHFGNLLLAYSLCFKQFSDCVNLRLGKAFGRMRGSALGNHVGHIIGWRSLKKMIWVYTLSIIAFVKDERGWNRVPVDYPAYAVRHRWDFGLFPICDHAVSMGADVPGPRPASIASWLPYFGPKSFPHRVGPVQLIKQIINRLVRHVARACRIERNMSTWH